MTEQPAQDELTLAKRRLGSVLAQKWQLERLIGLGGMAAVYASRDPSTGGFVAIKILHSEFSTNDGVRARFVREAQLTQAVEHPGRVEVYDQGQSDEGDPFFVMELLQGVTLDKLWKKHERRLPVEYALEITDRVLDFLGACHELKIVHRDLKPANIFITDAGYVKVLDFGVARLREAGVDPTLAGTALGTPAYMAPEQALGSSERIDARTDLFSMGAVLHAMVSGKRLHEGRSHQEAFVLAATRPAPSVSKSAPDLPPDVVALVDRALSWDPRNRFQSAQEMRDEIARVLSVLGGAAGQPAAPEPQHAAKENMLAALAEAERAVDAEGVSPEDEMLQRELGEVFVRVERTLTSVRQYTWDHRVTLGHMQGLHEIITTFLTRFPEALNWEVRPHSFARKGAVVWEPLHPFDDIPYNLFASGFRQFAITPGVTLEEVKSFVELLRLDPLRDFSSEDDLATAFWERQLEHIEYKVVMSFLAVNASDDAATEFDELMESGRSLVDSGIRRRAPEGGGEEALTNEEKAASIAARQIALRAVRATSALALDDRSRNAISAALEMPDHEWEARFVHVLADATSDAVAYGNLALAAVPLRGAIYEHASNQSLEFALRLTTRVAETVLQKAGPQVRAELIESVLDDDSFAIVLRELARHVPENERPRVVACAAPIGQLLEHVGPRLFDTVLAAMPKVDVDEVREAFGKYLELHAVGREMQIGELLAGMDLQRGRIVLSILSRLKSEAAAEALRAAESSAHAELRVEAVAIRAASSAEGLRDELSRLTTDPDPAVRMAALRTMARYKVKEAGPPLVQHIQTSGFHKLPMEEKQLALDTLWELSPARAESLALDLCLKSSVITREAVDDTRILAIAMLERVGRSAEVVEALDETAGKWGNSQAVRNAAAQAAAALRVRLGRR